MEVWLRRRRRWLRFIDFRFEAAAATLSATGSASPRPDRDSWLRGAPACSLSGISGWFSLSLGAWLPKNLARRSMEVWLRRRRRRFSLGLLISGSRRRPRRSQLRGQLRHDPIATAG